MRKIKWDKRITEVIFLLANGYTVDETAKTAKVAIRTIYYWKTSPEFIKELDRLSLATDVALKAERLRICKRMIRNQLMKKMPTQKDLLDWLKYAKEEAESITIAIADYTAQREVREFTSDSGFGQRVINANPLESTEPKAIGLLESPTKTTDTT